MCAYVIHSIKVGKIYQNEREMAVKVNGKDEAKVPKNKTNVIKRSQGYKYDWDAVRTQYIEGIKVINKNGKATDSREFTSLKELAERCKVPYERVREVSARESWVDNRTAYQMRMAKQRQAARIMKLSHESVDFDDKTLSLAKMGVGLIHTRLGEITADVAIAQARKKVALEQMALGFDIDPKDLRSAIWSKEMDELARAAVTWQQIGAKSLGTDVIKHALQVEASLDIDVAFTSVSAELGRDDPERLAAFMLAAHRSGFGSIEFVQESEQVVDELQNTSEKEIKDAEIITTE